MFDKLLGMFGKKPSDATAMVQNVAAKAGISNYSEEEIDRIVAQRCEERAQELQEMIDSGEGFHVGHLAIAVVNLEMKKLRHTFELSPELASARFNQIVQDAVAKYRTAPHTVLEPAGTNMADVTYVNIMGSFGDGLIQLRREGPKIIADALTEIVRQVGRPNDPLAAAIIDGTYNDALWERHAEIAQSQPEDESAGFDENMVFTGQEAEFQAYTQMFASVDTSAPELQPIAGITLHDYVAASALMHGGTSANTIAERLGVERPQWDEAAAGWLQRITDYPMSVGMQYTTLMHEPHPVLSGDGAGGTTSGSNAEKLNSDRDFFCEVYAAMLAVGEFGEDADGYVQEHYGVTMAEASAAGTRWMSDPRHMTQVMSIVQRRQEEITEDLRKEFGGGIADDIEF
ncbi:MAG: hypothetical protein Q4D85_02865 [Corynebacterium sp.]|uniref:DUF6620 family protein n=1 Tax=Corynebacterium sp. TaxID=1720 RepID=UPI0026DD4A0D|nr:DUF6620 family protein [Corynebacterium sp.]MDO5097672.1 hypothetical protein [Corynebacterium sp.]